MFFDTNIIINVLDSNGDKNVYDLVYKYIKNKEAFISVIVYSEVLAFPKLTQEEVVNLKFYLENNFKIVNVDKKSGLLASEISIQKRLQTGKKLKLTDAIIAATAILNKKELFTFDREDFKDIQKLKLFKF